ncbi:MAG: hypothetical protein GX558_12880 [Clostridiales bacterium]|nr:hypothetical protein [Clostridiales bacterium]
MPKQDDIPEAVASVTYSLESPDGFNILFTVRGTSGAELLSDMRKSIEPELKFQGYKPQVKNSFGPKPKAPPEVVPDRKCPMCGSELHYGTTKAGVRFIKCSTQTYDFKTGAKGGCQFTEWPNNTMQAGG